jgi:hypothetical protein
MKLVGPLGGWGGAKRRVRGAALSVLPPGPPSGRSFYDSNAGATYVLYGPVSGVVDLSGADAKLEGEANSQSGYALAAGNIDG